jgi:hypothetical protein
MEERTIISSSPSVPPPPQRELDSRKKTVLQVGKIITDEQQSLCLLRVIGAAGVMAHVTTPLSIGQSVAVGFRSSHCILGHVRWSREQLVGIEFEKPVDLETMLVMQRRAIGGQFLPESVRLDVHGTALIESEGAHIVTELFDISLAGAKIANQSELPTGTHVTLVIEGLPHRSGSIRWKRDGRAGIAFHLAMPFDVLAAWALKQPPRTTLASIRAALGDEGPATPA